MNRNLFLLVSSQVFAFTAATVTVFISGIIGSQLSPIKTLSTLPPSILAGVNQTVMLSLAMVVVASLIGAKGLGQDVLEALQYANVGQGILAGVAILFVALILDRVVQGKKRV